MRFAFISMTLALMTGGIPAFATPADSCEDLSFRLYRADLAPGGVKVHEVESDEFGDHQMVELFVKNVGTVRLGAVGDGDSFNVAPIRVKLGSYVADGYVDLPVMPGAFATVWLRLPAGAIDHCQLVDVRIDLTKTAKQKGCDCFDNDQRVTRAVVAGEPSCRNL